MRKADMLSQICTTQEAKSYLQVSQWILASAMAIVMGTSSHAAVIVSSCPIRTTTDNQRLENPLNEAALSALGRPSEDLVRLLSRFSRWLGQNQMPIEQSQVASQLGVLVEDFQLNLMLSPEINCAANDQLETKPLAIFPFALRPKTAGDSIRVRYKVCEYYVDQQRQLPFEDACAVLGKTEGYTLAQLDQRFQVLKTNLETLQGTVEGGTYLAGLLASVGVFRGLRLVKTGTFTSGVVAATPTLLAGAAIKLGYTDEILRDHLDFKNAAEVAITGDLTTAVSVRLPMQEFTPFFARYLDAI